MAPRPTVALALLTFAALAGCSDGPPSGDLVAIAGTVMVEGTSQNTYIPASGGVDNPACATVPPGTPCGPEEYCPPEDASDAAEPCVPASSSYKGHFMCLPEPDGNGYQLFQTGTTTTITERSLTTLVAGAPCENGNMYDFNHSVDGEDQSTMFEKLELRMGSFKVAEASSASGSQAFVANPALGTVTVTGSYKGRTLDLDVQGLEDGVEYVGRLYTTGASGNLTVAESFPVVAGAQSFKAEFASIGEYVEFHIHVGTSKIYVYQATI